MNDEGRVLDGMDGQEGGSAGVKGRKERYWMRFLKGMVTDCNTVSGPHILAFFCHLDLLLPLCYPGSG
jgi:hypothetical protein